MIEVVALLAIYLACIYISYKSGKETGWLDGREFFDSEWRYSVHVWKDDVKFADGGGATLGRFRFFDHAKIFQDKLIEINEDPDKTYFISEG